MKAIGGYFELETKKGKEFHKNLIKLNSGRTAFEYILLANQYSRIYIPHYTCDVILEPLIRNKFDFQFYSVDERLNPIFDYNIIKSNEAFLYTNYFGVQDNFVNLLSSKIQNLIIDNAQSFFSKPILNTCAFYSPRKFFGLPDGGYVHSKKKLDTSIERDVRSIERMSHLILRLGLNAEMGYAEFCQNDASLQNEKMLQMSNLTQRLLAGIDYSLARKKRIKNFEFLHKELQQHNLFDINKCANQVPMVYPFRTKNPNLREILLKKRIYTAKYWPNLASSNSKIEIEKKLVNEFIHLPIDQRYDENHMIRIIEQIQKHV
ncbi:MAG: hypothetical protein Q4F57_03700 [Weeksellaceae bacterium]|nr:hypothetical protein [Weeksellaceae bacterium]